MTAVALRPRGRIGGPAIAATGLGVAVTLRWAATVSGAADAITIGAVFGVGLLAVAVLGGWRPMPSRASSVAVGVVGGAVLIGLAIATRSGPMPGLAPAASFGPWAAATILVATAEELVLRGALFDAIDRRLGVALAVTVTAVLFAIMHVPLYGWHVVPLDLGVGLWLAGLRLATGGLAAPAIAHTAADLATWLL
jgi:membrane protease YdiL (CAAX protease family)